MVNGSVYELNNDKGNSLLYMRNFDLCWAESITDNGQEQLKQSTENEIV
jgi:hypothetical protein